MASEHFGVIDSEKVYSLETLAKLLGFQQPRTVEKKLIERGAPLDRWGGVTFISGKDFQLAIERSARCERDDKSE